MKKIANQKKHINLLYKVLSTIKKLIDSFVFNGEISTSVPYSVTESGLILIPISAGVFCGLKITNKVLYEINRNEKNK